MKNSIVIILALLFAVVETATAQSLFPEKEVVVKFGKTPTKIFARLDSMKTLLVDSTMVEMIILGKDTVWRKSPDLPKLSGMWTLGDTGMIRRFYSKPQTYFFNFPGFSNPAGARTVVGKDTTTKLAPYSAVAVFTLLQSWEEYLAWCADSVQKRGLNLWVADTTAPYILDNEGVKTYWRAKIKPNYYRAPNEPYPTFNGFIEWLRQRTK